MENKLTWVELKKAVARQTGLTGAEVNTILTIWLDEMVTALKRGDELHIGGLGTFKVKTMKPRKSVDVTTGEAIILPETNRLTFTMASGLDETLHNGASVKSKMDIDPIEKLSDQADEIMNILEEMGQGTKVTESHEEQKANSITPERVAIPDYQIPENKPIQPASAAPTMSKAQPTKKERLWLTASITIIVFLGLLIGLFFFFQYKIERWINNLREEAEMVEQADTEEQAVPIEAVEQVEETEEIVPEKEVESSEPAEEIEQGKQVNYREYTEFIGTEQMHQDSRLAWMAYRYYGKKQLWVFIYDANKDHLSNPGQIAVGTPIRIPKLSNEIINLTSPEIQMLVKQMEQEFLGQ